MSRFFKAVLGTETGVRTISAPTSREDITQDEAKECLEAIVASQAIDGVTDVVKGVIYTSDTEVIYEA